MYESVYSSSATTTITILFALSGVFMAIGAVLWIYWNVREIRRNRGRNDKRARRASA